jgi:hypothetical protein
MSGVQAMFDTFSALLLMLTVIMFYKDRYFIGGALFSVAVLLKFFPAFCILVLLAYIVVKHREDGSAKKKLLESVLGMAIMSFVLMFPLIINGQVGDAFSFVFGRTGETTFFQSLFVVFNVSIGVLCSVFFGYQMIRTPAGESDKRMFVYVLLTVAASTLISITPQYVIVFIPFLILHILATDRSFLKCWIIIGIAAFVGAFTLNNYSLLAALSGYTTFVSPEWLISGMQFLESGTSINLVGQITFTANVLQYFGILLLILFGFSELIVKKMPKLGTILMRIKGGEVADRET